MSNQYMLRDSVWESVYHPLWKTVWEKKESLDARVSTFKPFENSFRNSIINPVCDVCFETIEKINNE
jgi:hypothetical protein